MDTVLQTAIRTLYEICKYLFVAGRLRYCDLSLSEWYKLWSCVKDKLLLSLCNRPIFLPSHLRQMHYSMEPEQWQHQIRDAIDCGDSFLQSVCTILLCGILRTMSNSMTTEIDFILQVYGEPRLMAKQLDKEMKFNFSNQCVQLHYYTTRRMFNKHAHHCKYPTKIKMINPWQRARIWKTIFV